MKSGEKLVQDVQSDKKYQQILKAAPADSREHIQHVMDEFLKELGQGLNELERLLTDPEVRRQLQDAMLQRER